MKKKNYDEVSVIRSITKKADVSVDYVNKIIQVKKITIKDVVEHINKFARIKTNL